MTNVEQQRIEALRAGQDARVSLVNALSALNSARGWGIYDILRGGTIATIIKHAKMNKASAQIEEAKTALRRFSRELGDIAEYASVNLSTRDFWGFADWFFDGLLADWLMQNRINDARTQIQAAISKVDSILKRLT